MTDAEFGRARQAARPLRIIARFFRRSWQALLVVVLAICLGIGAYLSPGLVQADVHLDEGTVYVVNREGPMMGTVNAQIDELSAATNVGDSQFYVLQHRDKVEAVLPQSSNLHPYQPGRNILGQASKVPTNAVLQQVDNMLLVYDRENGRVWHGTTEDMLQVDFHRDKAQLEVGEFGVATLTKSGKVIGLNVQDATLVRVQGEIVTTTPVPIAFNARTANVEISAVGDSAVVLDRDNGLVWVEGLPKAFTLTGKGQAKLLRPATDVLGGAKRSRGLVATQAGLLGISSDGMTSLSGPIALPIVVQPVQVGDCVYGAFSDGAGELVLAKRCVDEEPVITKLDHLVTDGSGLAFQVNRTTVALNDRANGTVWLVNRGTVILPADWDHVRPIDFADETEYTEGDPNVLPDRTRENRPPIAKDDENLGARVGQSTILTVLDNDTDPDGDVLTISVPNTEIGGATLQSVRGGAGLQITVDPDVPVGTVLQVPYTVHDGNDHSDNATAFVKVFPEDATVNNQKPFPRGLGSSDIPPPQPPRVRMGDTDVKFRALLDWRDPEGDPLLLKEAWMDPAFDDIVRFTTDGEITYTDVGKTYGEKIIHVTVADAHGAEIDGQITVDVSEEVIPPTTYGDFATTLQGETVTVEPLANDIRAENLTEVNAECQECVEAFLADNRFTFTSERVGSHYIEYSVNNGGSGLVRIDVLPRLANRKPVAVLDIAHVPDMGSVTIDPLLNDTDPDGDVLVIQTLGVIPDSLKVTMERRTLLTIEATQHLTQREVIKYRVTDATESSEGTIIVIPTPASNEVGPRVIDDTLRVRAGATGSVDVLENDMSSDGRPLKLSPELVENPFGDRAWVEGDKIRVAVPPGSVPGVQSIRYRVSDSAGEERDGLLRVTVVSEEASNADPPRPRQVIDRMLAGTTTRIPIPLDGIDPQGDSVRLVGLASIPSLGRVMKVGERYFEYEAFINSAGTDTFLYEVVDSHGVKATGEVRVGVARPSQLNNPPVGVLDEVLTRPGRTVQLDPLLNDYDLDGDPIFFASDRPAQMGPIEVELVGDRDLVMVAPQEPGTYTGTYDIMDLRGENGSGAIVLKVDEEAPLLPPVTRDDLVDAGALANNTHVAVQPLLNDYDPDGSQDQLSILLPDADPDDDLAARLTADDEVTIGVRDAMQQVRYVAVDADGLETSGVITVPGRNDVVPTLKTLASPMTVTAGGTPLTIDINEVVDGTHGREVKLSGTKDIQGLQGVARAAGDGQVIYDPNKDYFGPAVVVFKVEDVMQATDGTVAPSAFISVPVDVKKAQVAPGTVPDGTDPDTMVYLVDQPPVLLTDEPVIEVGAGEEPRSLDATKLFRDPEHPDGGSLSLEGLPVAVSGDAPIELSVRGNIITAFAPETARRGQTKRFLGHVLDSSIDGNRQPFPLTVRVVASRFPKVTPASNLVGTVHAGGEPITIQVTEGAVSHLPLDKSVYLEGARIATGSGTVTVDPATGSVKISASPNQNGTMTVAYTLNDALRDPERVSQGAISIKVLDVPPAPEPPYGEAGVGTINVRYLSKATGDLAAGLTSTGEATPVAGGRVVPGQCGGGLCTFTGLTNGVSYTVRVTDHNVVGPSAPSNPSAALTPDAKLLPPSVPIAIFRDRALSVSWNHERLVDSTHGTSGVKHYLLTAYKAGTDTALGTQEVVGARAYLWTGLENGQLYEFTVQAISNHSGTDPARFNSEPTTRSEPKKPIGLPLGSIGVDALTHDDDIGGGFRVTFNTGGVNDNGDAIARYRVVPFSSSGEHTNRQSIVDARGGGTSFTTNIYGMGTTPTQFRVYAENQAGESALGTSPTAITSWAKPKITGLVVTPRDGELVIKADESSPSGAPVTLQYSVGSGWETLTNPAGTVVGGLTNGQPYTVTVRATLEKMIAEASAEAMPKSTVPGAPSISGLKLDPGLKAITATVGSMTWLETGGWNPETYQFCGSGGTSCQGGKFGTGRSVSVPVGGGNVLWTVPDSPGSGALPVAAADVETPSLDSNERLSFRFTYVDSGSCVITLNWNSNPVRKTVTPTNGILSYGPEAQLIEQPPKLVTPSPTPEDPTPTPIEEPVPPVPASKIDVFCAINSTSGTNYRLK